MKATKDYPIRVYKDIGENYEEWVAEYPDLEGCIGVGGSPEEAIIEAEINKELWLEAAREIGQYIPAPSKIFSNDFSGKFNLRLPKSLHRDLALRAEEEGVSLNTLCSTLLAKAIKPFPIIKNEEKCNQNIIKKYQKAL